MNQDLAKEHVAGTIRLPMKARSFCATLWPTGANWQAWIICGCNRRKVKQFNYPKGFADGID